METIETVNGITAADAAKQMDGCQYRAEGSRDLFALMKASGLVAVFGASDDLMEFHGAIEDEVGAYGEAVALVDREGLLPDREQIDDDATLERYFARKPKATSIKTDGELPWRYETDVPHEEFKVYEDGELYGTGIVFALSDLPA